MTTEVTPPVPTNPATAALEAQGVKDGLAGAADDAKGGMPVPPAPTNTPPVVEPTDEEKAKAAQDATDKAAEEAKTAAEDKEKADAAAQAETDAQPLNTELWSSTGDEAGDAVLTLMQNGGMQPEEAKALMYDAIVNGDVTKIDRAALVEKVGEAKATLIMAGAESFIDKGNARVAGIMTEVHEAAGGEANWKALTVWANKAAAVEGSTIDLDMYRTMIDAGGAQARFATSELTSLYNADTGNTTLETAATTEIRPGGAPVNDTKGITRGEYVAQLSAHHRSGGGRAAEAAIQAARELGRKQGI